MDEVNKAYAMIKEIKDSTFIRSLREMQSEEKEDESLFNYSEAQTFKN